MTEFDTVIGLECHVQLKTKSKLFSPAPNRFGDAPNQNVDVVDAGLPGVLPVLNEKAVTFAIKLGLALGCKINQKNVFARKHYFYPDLPKGYQISQFELPICEGGAVEIQTSQGRKKINLTRIHMEEDAGKNLHVQGADYSEVDYNRAGTPLLEVVTEPEITCAEEAVAFFKSLRATVMALDICDGNLEEGSMRSDANVSVKPAGQKELGQRTEIKNLNSMRFLGQAIEFERKRHIRKVKAGEPIKMQTRLFDPDRKETRSMREKEEAHDYRYFPDPDLPPLIIEDETLSTIQTTLPELPMAKADRYQNELGLSEYDANLLIEEKEVATYFENCLQHQKNAKGVANWVLNNLLAALNENELSPEQIAQAPISPERLAELVRLIDEKVVTSKIAKQLFEEMWQNPQTTPEQIVEDKGWKVQRDEGALLKIITDLVAAHPKEVQQYLGGKQKVLGFFMGQVMKQTKGQAEPKETTELLKKHLETLRD